MSGTTGPTLAGFQWFITNIMQIPANYLPLTSPTIAWVLAIAMNTVNPDLQQVGNAAMNGLPETNMYNVAVYNLAGSLLLNLAQDQPGFNYFTQLRSTLGLTAFAVGVVQSSADASTSESLLVPEFVKNLTAANLQQLKDPYGRMYLQIAQSYGPSIWVSVC